MYWSYFTLWRKTVCIVYLVSSSWQNVLSCFILSSLEKMTHCLPGKFNYWNWNWIWQYSTCSGKWIKHLVGPAAAEWLTCRGVASAGKLYFMYSTCCAVSWQSAKTQPRPRSDILSQSPPSYDSRPRQTTELVSVLRVVSEYTLYHVAALSLAVSVWELLL